MTGFVANFVQVRVLLKLSSPICKIWGLDPMNSEAASCFHKHSRGGGFSSVVKCLPSKHKALGLVPSTKEKLK
jgi:hypothetical protein